MKPHSNLIQISGIKVVGTVKLPVLPLCPSSRAVGLGPADSTSSGLQFPTPAFPNCVIRSHPLPKSFFLRDPGHLPVDMVLSIWGGPWNFNILNSDHSHCVQLGISAFHWRLWLHFNSKYVWRWQWAVIDSLHSGLNRRIMDSLFRRIT